MVSKLKKAILGYCLAGSTFINSPSKLAGGESGLGIDLGIGLSQNNSENIGLGFGPKIGFVADLNKDYSVGFNLSKYKFKIITHEEHIGSSQCSKLYSDSCEYYSKYTGDATINENELSLIKKVDKRYEVGLGAISAKIDIDLNKETYYDIANASNTVSSEKETFTESNLNGWKFSFKDLGKRWPNDFHLYWEFYYKSIPYESSNGATTNFGSYGFEFGQRKD